MKTLILIPLIVLLSGCATKVPVAMKFPVAPETLLISCKDLEQVKPNEEQLSEMLKVVVTNYGQYHECRAKVDLWIEWYKSQKDIHDSVTGRGN
jgi:hypothetical protein